MTRLLLSFVGLASLLVLTGCPEPAPAPDPSQTVVGTARSARSNSPGYISTTDFYGAGSAGLEPRGSGMGSGSGSAMGGFDGERFEDVLDPVYFDFDAATVKPSERPKLDEAADYLSSNPEELLIVEGHADWRGTSEYNLALSDRRASSVKQYLTTLGVSGDRIEVVPKGDLEAQENASESTMSEDRRADLIVVR